VPAGAGILTGNRATGYTVRHSAARWHGSPVSGRYIGGCPGEADQLNTPAGTPEPCGRELADTTDCRYPGHAKGYHPDPAVMDAGSDAGLAELSRAAGPGTAVLSSGAIVTTSRGRCEDAPCCGCCD
jgi:hypothetical protein